MKVKEFIIQQTRRNDYAEKVFYTRIRKALEQTIMPAIEVIATDLYNADRRIDSVMKGTYIESALKWLYVEWGYYNMIWFRRNLPFEKKDFWQDALASNFERFGAEKVTEILGTTLKLIKPQIKEALKLASEGKSIDKIREEVIKNVKKEGGAMSKGRAQTIARTEVISASNLSTYEAVKSTGADVEKKWVTGGKNIRETHKAASRQGWIGMDEDFKVGDYRMAHPGDHRGGAEEVCNCKCINIYRVKD